MTTEQVATLIELIATSIGVDCAYSHFSDGIERDDFLVWYYMQSEDMYADNINYQEISPIRLEYYSKQKDLSKERAIQSILKQNKISYEKDNSYIQDENEFLTIYEFEVLINE